MPDIWMDVDVALSEVPVNIFPLTDDTDFKTRETSVAYNATGMDLVFNFVTCAGAFTQTAVTPTTAGVYDWTHQGDGMYTIEIPASGGASINNDTEGVGWFTGMATGVLPWRGPTIGFRAATVNDALIESDTFITAADLGILYEGLVSSIVSQTSFNMDTAIVTDDVWIGQTCTIEDVSTGEIWSTYVTDIDQTNDRILVNAAAPFTAVATDKIRVYREKSPAYVQSTVFQTTLTEGYAADGSEPTMEQAVYMIMQMLTEFAINNGVLTVKRLDGSTTAATFTLDDPTEPTSITRSS